MRYRLYKSTLISTWCSISEQQFIREEWERKFKDLAFEWVDDLSKVKPRLAELNAPTRNLHKFTFIKLVGGLQGWIYSIPITGGWDSTRYVGDPMEKLKELVKEGV